jgi:DNA-nicking Smr family endonuclease
MPRRRLHGETQKRRKKARTRLLKRSETPLRVQATQQPAPFERATTVEREDLEFLEAMRVLEVRRGPWSGEASARREAVEQVQFLADDGERSLFLRSMAHQGVHTLDGTPPPVPGAPANDSAEPETAPAPVTGAAGRPAGTAAARSVDPDEGRPVAAPPPPAREARVEFDSEDDAHAVMDALLRDSGFEPGQKFAGVNAPTKPKGLSREPRRSDDLEPDDELDLHGKTQEEAIRRVQGFLLTSARRRLRHVLIITGRGLNSGATGPVLRDAVQRWLELNGKPYLRHFAEAPPRLGGAGALWLTLR